MGTYQPTNIPINLNLNDLKSAADNAGQYAKSCRFVVRIGASSLTGGSSILKIMNTTKDFIYMCEAVEFPGRGFDVTQIRYNGPSQVFPNNTMYNQASLSFICRTYSPERAFFDDWMDIINPTSSWNFEYADNYYSTIQIYQLAEFGQGLGTQQNAQITPVATYGWTLNKAWPTLVNPQQVTWADQDILRLQVTFAYKYWDRPDYKQ